MRRMKAATGCLERRLNSVIGERSKGGEGRGAQLERERGS